MKKTLWIILALVMALTLVIGSVSTVSANTTLPSLNVALTNVTGDSYGGYYENITCTARMVEVLPEYPATGGTAKGRFSWTFGGGSKYGSQAYHITGNIIYLSVGEVSGRKAAWVTVEITQQNLEYPQYLIVLFDENGGFGTQGVYGGATPEWSLQQVVNENLTEDGGKYGHVSINF